VKRKHNQFRPPAPVVRTKGEGIGRGPNLGSGNSLCLVVVPSALQEKIADFLHGEKRGKGGEGKGKGGQPAATLCHPYQRRGGERGGKSKGEEESSLFFCFPTSSPTSGKKKGGEKGKKEGILRSHDPSSSSGFISIPMLIHHLEGKEKKKKKGKRMEAQATTPEKKKKKKTHR